MGDDTGCEGGFVMAEDEEDGTCLLDEADRGFFPLN